MQKMAKNNLFLFGFIFLIIIGLILAFVLNTKFSVIKSNPFKSSKLNILVIGYDSSINGPPRADTIILASIDVKTKEVGVLSIPRDTRVNIPGHGVNRINASHAFGGVELTSKTLESFLNIPIDYYVETDFKGFAQIIDILGGVELDIKKPLHYTDKAGGLYINLPAGRQKLNGNKALQYVRYRESVYGDIGRVQRQQKFIKAVMKKVLSPDLIVKLPTIYKSINKTVKTNVPVQDISPFMHLIKEMSLDQIKIVMVPGEPKYINGASYWIADKKELAILLDDLIRSKEYIKNSQYHLSFYNGNGKSGVAAKFAHKLAKYGFKIDKVGNADNFNYHEIIIKYFDIRDKVLAYNIKELIGGKIRYEKNDQKKGLEIIIGADYFIEE